MTTVKCEHCNKTTNTFYIPCLTGFGASYMEADDKTFVTSGGKWYCKDHNPKKPQRNEVKTHNTQLIQ